MEPEWARSNWQSFCVRLPDGWDQAELMQSLLELGIATRRGVMCSHLEAAYANQSAAKWTALPESERAHRSSVILPLFHTMSEEQQDRVIDALVEFRPSR
jgi:dTDP-4-amino-4,6-dideoxygalactose transaminase